MNATDARNTSRPAAPAPKLELPLIDGDRFELAARSPTLFTLVVFNRGLHCPVCQAQLKELDRRFSELGELGIEAVSVSAETEHRAGQMRDEWKLSQLPLAYGLSEESMREWGLFVSKAISDNEPPVFNEPGMFLIKPDGTIYYESLLSMPMGRPRLDEVLKGIEFWTTNDYPARGGE